MSFAGEWLWSTCCVHLKIEPNGSSKLGLKKWSSRLGPSLASTDQKIDTGDKCLIILYPTHSASFLMFGFQGIKSILSPQDSWRSFFFAYIYYHLMHEYLMLYSVVCQTRQKIKFPKFVVHQITQQFLPTLRLVNMKCLRIYILMSNSYYLC